MFEVKNRSVESWGPLAEVKEDVFKKILRDHGAKDKIKDAVKRHKKLKTYKVTFKKIWASEPINLQAESEYDVSAIAQQYFKENQGNIGFFETPQSQWAGGYRGYDTISYVKVIG